MAYNESIFPMARYSVFLHAGTDADFCLIVEDTFYCRTEFHRPTTPAE